MKQLPPLSLDIRNAALISGQDYLNVIVPADGLRVIGRINSICGSFDHAGEMVDRINKYPAAVEALRALAIVPTMKPGVQAVVHDGHRCRVCATTWPEGKPEQHQGWCVLKGTES